MPPTPTPSPTFPGSLGNESSNNSPRPLWGGDGYEPSHKEMCSCCKGNRCGEDCARDPIRNTSGVRQRRQERTCLSSRPQPGAYPLGSTPRPPPRAATRPPAPQPPHCFRPPGAVHAVSSKGPTVRQAPAHPDLSALRQSQNQGESHTEICCKASAAVVVGTGQAGVPWAQQTPGGRAGSRGAPPEAALQHESLSFVREAPLLFSEPSTD